MQVFYVHADDLTVAVYTNQHIISNSEVNVCCHSSIFEIINFYDPHKHDIKTHAKCLYGDWQKINPNNVANGLDFSCLQTRAKASADN